MFNYRRVGEGRSLSLARSAPKRPISPSFSRLEPFLSLYKAAAAAAEADGGFGATSNVLSVQEKLNDVLEGVHAPPRETNYSPRPACVRLS